MGGASSHDEEVRLAGFEAELHRIMCQMREIRRAPAINEEERHIKLRFLQHRFDTITSADFDLPVFNDSSITADTFNGEKSSVGGTVNKTRRAFVVDKDKKNNKHFSCMHSWLSGLYNPQSFLPGHRAEEPMGVGQAGHLDRCHQEGHCGGG